MGDDILVYVGTYTEPIQFGTGRVLRGKGGGIYLFRLDGASGALEPLGTTPATNPSYLALDPTGRCLYAVNELKTYGGQPSGTVSAFSVDSATGALKFLNRRLTGGTDPCHVVVSPSGSHVFVANFMSGSVCVLPVHADGSLGEASGFVQHRGSSVDPIRQAGPHAHSVTLDPGGRFALVPDLGLDEVMIYRVDARRGTLEPADVPWIATRPGAGPRHVAFHPAGSFAYLINELDSTVVALSYDGWTGALRELQTVPTLPEGFEGPSTCADVQVSPSGAFLYGSNRGHDSLAIFVIDPLAGRLGLVGHELTRGRTPRSFGIDPTGRFLLVANQDSDTIVTFRVHASLGTLEPTGHVAPVPTPVCVKFVSHP
jgi:6-phosphogluconolactonase